MNKPFIPLVYNRRHKFHQPLKQSSRKSFCSPKNSCRLCGFCTMFSSWTNLCYLGPRKRRKTLGVEGLLHEELLLKFSLGSQLEREQSFFETSPRFVSVFKGQCSKLWRSSQTQIGTQCWSQSSVWSQQDLPPTAVCQVLYHRFVFWPAGGCRSLQHRDTDECQHPGHAENVIFPQLCTKLRAILINYISWFYSLSSN